MAGKLTGIEIFANIISGTVKYSILGFYCVCGIAAHIGNKVKEWTGDKRKREGPSCTED